jgi:pilus assembly protein Flp/PilA
LIAVHPTAPGAVLAYPGGSDMKRFLTEINTFLSDEEGVTAIEYGLIAALIAVAIIGGVTAIGSNLGQLFNNVSTAITNAINPPAQ